ncbi:uncharacterized protein si:ch211-191i18.4 isoform X1 [Sander lucioperca]|uniref:uncharacterized protein si:ch211-191i18.4 isoform X1 n=1 Tax=Sander lucioperca TaxID=283035 RepID=UPI00165386E6|nr:uncharacterized protein si:ch211-191i18.4 isoform X1 [Sander lucioperca]
MELNMCSVFLLLIGWFSLQRVGCRLPDVIPQSHWLQVGVSESHDFTSLQKKNESHDFTSLQKKNVRRLPGLCRRLKRRRLTVLCNKEKFCWPTQTQRTRPVQVCLCPRGSRCSHFFVHSL